MDMILLHLKKWCNCRSKGREEDLGKHHYHSFNYYKQSKIQNKVKKILRRSKK
jgi:hypothetical protein